MEPPAGERHTSDVDDEARLVERARRGDEAAFGLLVRRHQTVAFRTACVLAGDAADAEEAAAEGFVKAWSALPRFRADAPFRPWLLSIVANEARMRRRAAGRRAGWTVRAAERARLAEPPPTPEDAVLVAERTSELLRGLAALAEDHRAVVELRHVLGLSEAETAAALGCRPGTVKSRLSRALELLRAEVER